MRLRNAQGMTGLPAATVTPGGMLMVNLAVVWGQLYDVDAAPETGHFP